VEVTVSELPALLFVLIGLMVGFSLLASWWRDCFGPDRREADYWFGTDRRDEHDHDHDHDAP